MEKKENRDTLLLPLPKGESMYLPREIFDLNELFFIQSIPYLLQTFPNLFKSHKQVIAYLLSDGIKSSKEIGKLVDVSGQTILNWWNDWLKIEIVSKFGSQGQAKHNCSILELYIKFLGDGEKKDE